MHQGINHLCDHQMKLLLFILTLNTLPNTSSTASFQPSKSSSVLTMDNNIKLKCDFETDLCSWRDEIKYNNGLRWHLSPDQDNMTNLTADLCSAENDDDDCDAFTELQQVKPNRYLYVTSNDLNKNGSYVRISHFPLAAQSSGYCILSLKYIAFGVGFAKLVIGARLIDHFEPEPILVIYSSESTDWQTVKVPLIANYIFTPIIEARHNDDSLSAETELHGSKDGFIAIDDAEISRGCIHDPTDDAEAFKLISQKKSLFRSIKNKKSIKREDIEKMEKKAKKKEVEEDDEDKNKIHFPDPEPYISDRSQDVRIDVPSQKPELSNDKNNAEFIYDYTVKRKGGKRIPEIISKDSKVRADNEIDRSKFDLNQVFKLKKSKELQDALNKSLAKSRSGEDKVTKKSKGKKKICDQGKGKEAKAAKEGKLEETIICQADDSCVTTRSRTINKSYPNSCTLDDIDSEQDFKGQCGWTQDKEEIKFGKWLLISGDYAGRYFARFPIIDSSSGTLKGQYLMLNIKKSHFTPTIHLNSPLLRDTSENCYFTFSYIIYDRNAIFYLHLITLSAPEEEQEAETEDEKEEKDGRRDDDGQVEYDETTYVLWKGQANRNSRLGKWFKGSAFIGRQKELFYLSFIRSSAPHSSFGTIALDDFKFISC